LCFLVSIKKKNICQKVFKKKFGASMVCISICPKLSSIWFPFEQFYDEWMVNGVRGKHKICLGDFYSQADRFGT